MVKVEIIEEFTDEKKFAGRVEKLLKTTPEAKIHYAVTTADRGILYTALVIS